ncbi:hypothetical protein MRX96_021359 [Rhipicephalus microplus]
MLPSHEVVGSDFAWPKHKWVGESILLHKRIIRYLGRMVPWSLVVSFEWRRCVVIAVVPDASTGLCLCPVRLPDVQCATGERLLVLVRSEGAFSGRVQEQKEST